MESTLNSEVDADEAGDAYRSLSKDERDQERFYNYPSQAADFPFWCSVDYWTADEWAALTFGRNPRTVNWSYVSPFTEISPFAKEYQRRRRLLIRAIKSGALPELIPPKKAIAWAKKKNIEFPAVLVQMVLGDSNHRYKTVTRIDGTSSDMTENTGAAPSQNWKYLVQAQAAVIWSHLKSVGCKPTRRSITGDLSEWCRKENVNSDWGHPPAPDTIYKHAISKRYWTPPQC